jgi:CRP-like cAMP-binding protein
MGKEESTENLRKAILLSTALNERSLSDLLKLYSIQSIQKNDFFLHAGEYPLNFTFIDQGVVRSYYSDQQGKEIVRGLFVPGMFALPLPAFIYRKPSFLNFQAITSGTILTAKYSDVKTLANSDHSVHLFLQLLIEREWIVNRELYDAGLHVYNTPTRYRIFREKYGSFAEQIPDEYISSYLNIPLKQLQRIKLQEGK